MNSQLAEAQSQIDKEAASGHFVNVMKKRTSKIKRPCRLTVEEEEDGNISCEQGTWRKSLLPSPPNVDLGLLQFSIRIL